MPQSPLVIDCASALVNPVPDARSGSFWRILLNTVRNVSDAPIVYSHGSRNANTPPSRPNTPSVTGLYVLPVPLRTSAISTPPSGGSRPTRKPAMTEAQTHSPGQKSGWKMSWAREISELPQSTSRFTGPPSLCVHQTRRTCASFHPMSTCYHDVPDTDQVAALGSVPMGSYQDAYQRSLADPEAFWLAAAESIDWTSPPSRALDDNTAPLYRWFPDGELNTCHNTLDRHVDGGRADQVALIHDSPMTGSTASFTYRELRDEVATFAGALRSLGVGKGDRVIIYMPMVPRAVVAMLACARLGAVHSVVFGGFAPKELASRIEDAMPKVIVAASCGIEPTRVVEYKPIIEAALGMTEHQPD